MIYRNLKKALYFFLPEKFIKNNKLIFRKIVFVFFIGNKHACSICEKKFRRFIKIKNKRDNLCPYCGSISRDRRLYTLVTKELEKNKHQFPKILDFSPSDSIYNKLSRIENLSYSASDLSGNFNAKYQYDLTDVSCENNYFDFIICFHILEHIPEDIKAMQELYRIIKPNGLVFIQTPFKKGEIYENPSVSTPEGRKKHFGQEDHVRIYSLNGLKERLQNVGFKIETKVFSEDEFYGFKDNESIILALK